MYIQQIPKLGIQLFAILFDRIKTKCTSRVSVFLFFNQKEELDKKNQENSEFLVL